tara:strand:+ start:3871 stop:4230 length:360 start_codon:yes stop_codon:yes gene_type:complete
MRFCGSGELCKVNRAIGSPDDFLHIKNEIESGRARFISVMGTYFVLRVDSDGLVVVCAQGKNIAKSSAVIIKLAKKLGVKSIFFHTKRPALARLLKSCNFKFMETDPEGLLVYQMVMHE